MRKLTTREKKSRRATRARAIRKLTKSLVYKMLLSVVAIVFISGFIIEKISGENPVEAASSAVWKSIASYTANYGLVVNDILVSGRSKTSREELEQAIGVGIGSPILTVDLLEIQQNVNSLKWVKGVTVARRFPDTIIIALEERRPIALWQSGNELYLVDRDGEVITGTKVADYPSLPIIIGENAPARAFELFRTLALEPELFAEVSSATLVSNRRWNIRFYNGIEVKMPEDNLPSAWKGLASLNRSKSLLERDLISLDLRLKDRIFIKLPEDVMIPLVNPEKIKKGEAT